MLNLCAFQIFERDKTFLNSKDHRKATKSEIPVVDTPSFKMDFFKLYELKNVSCKKNIIEK